MALPVAVLVLIAGFFVRPLKKEVPRRPPKPLRETTAYRWSRVIQHRPWPAAIGGALVLLILALPVLALRLGFSDESNFAEDTTTKQAYDLLVDGFGPGFNGPLLLVAELPAGTDPGCTRSRAGRGRGRPRGGVRGTARVLNNPDEPDRRAAGTWCRRPDHRTRPPPIW